MALTDAPARQALNNTPTAAGADAASNTNQTPEQRTSPPLGLNAGTP